MSELISRKIIAQDADTVTFEELWTSDFTGGHWPYPWLLDEYTLSLRNHLMSEPTQSFDDFYDRLEAGELSDEAYAADIAASKESSQTDEDLIDFRREQLPIR